MNARKSSKFFFIHIPKTAGTSLNLHAQNVFGASEVAVHVESVVLPQPTDELLRYYAGKKFVSGHVPYDIFNVYFRNIGFTAMTIMREPISQFVSHIGYILRTLTTLPLIQGIACKLEQSVDFFLRHADDTEREFFRSPQSQTLFTGAYDWHGLSIDERCDVLSKTVRHVLFLDTISQDIGSVFRSSPAPDFPTENCAVGPLPILTQDDMAIISDWVSDDLKLYSAMKARALKKNPGREGKRLLSDKPDD